MPWQLCSASVKPAGIIQVFLAKSKTIPENSIKFETEVVFIKTYCKAYNWFWEHVVLLQIIVASC